MIDLLVDLWLLDAELGAAAARQHRVMGQKDPSDREVFRTLLGVASADVEMAKLVAQVSWFVDGLTHGELRILRRLGQIATESTELARLIASFPWFTDGSFPAEGALVDILSDSDIELLREMSGRPWFAEGGPFVYYVLRSVGRLTGLGADVLSKLTDQPWFADGLDKDEAALMVTLGLSALESPDLYADLLESHYTQHRIVSLPLAGDVNIWVFQNTPFPQDEDLLTIIEDTARISEGFLGVPFPTTDIILLVADEKEGLDGFHAGTYMVLSRGPDGVRSVRHETAHYYFSSGPQWLREGGAELIEAYVKDRTGIESISSRRTEVSERARSQCFELNEVENIRHYIYIGAGSGNTGPCPYYMGEDFLLNVVETIGEAAMGSALRELYPLVLAWNESGWEDDREEEEVVFDTFLKHTQPERQGKFRELYHRLHGGPYAYPVIDPSDDHGDDAATATEVAVGEVVEGALDYHFDFDYFKFSAEQGQRYQMRVDHETLRSSSVRLYGPDGSTHVRWLDIWTDEGDVSYRGYLRLTDTGRVSYGPKLRWTAPNSGDYYLAVHNFGGKSGLYTLGIAPVTPTPDDHGDSRTTATAILVGEVIEGTVDYDFDLDFFRIQAVAGREYLARIEPTTEPLLVHLRLYASDGTDPIDELSINYRSSGSAGGGSIYWVAPISGEYYLAAVGGFGLLGDYRLIIDESDSPWVDLTP